MKNLVFLIIFFLVIIQHLTAQTDFRDGFIVKLNMDTVYGQVDYRGDALSAKVCKFKNNLITKVEEYSPYDIAGYGFIDGKNYVTKTLDMGEEIKILQQKYFVEFLVKGLVNLYFYRDDKDHYFIEKQLRRN